MPVPLNRDWRGDGPEARQTRLGGVRAMLIAVVAVAATFLGVLSFARHPEPPVVVVLGVSTDADPGRDDAEVAAFAKWRTRGAAWDGWNLSRDDLRVALRGLGQTPRSQPLVVYWGGGIALDSAGELVLPERVSGGDHDRNPISFAELLEAVRACPSRHKLLVLDTSETSVDWVGPALRAVSNTPDPHRLVLFAHGPGEASHGRTAVNRRVFLDYLLAGLNGGADGWNDAGSQDSAVSVTELAAYLRARVSHWAEVNRPASQTPFLVGDGVDFPLATGASDLEASADPIPYPAPLTEAWAEVDRWRETGRAFREFGKFSNSAAGLLRAEQSWASAQPPKVILRMAAAAKVTLTAPQSVRPAALRPLPEPDPAVVDEVVRFLSNTPERLTNAEKPPAFTAESLLAAATARALPRAQLQRIAQLLTQLHPVPATEAEATLRRAVATDGVPEAAIRSLVRAASEWQAVATDPAFFPWSRDVLTELSAESVAVAVSTLSPGWVSGPSAADALNQYELRLRRVAEARQVFERASATAARASELLSYPDPAHDALRDPVRELDQALRVPDGPITFARLVSNAGIWAAKVEQLARLISKSQTETDPDAVHSAVTRCRAESAGPLEWGRARALLVKPFLRSADRASLWDAVLDLERRLAERVSRQDANEDEQIRTGVRRPTFVDPRLIPEPKGQRPPVREVPTPADTPPSDAWLNWHVRRLEYLRQNPWGWPDARTETAWATSAVQSCVASGGTVPVVARVELRIPPVVLTPASRAATVSVEVRLTPATGPATAKWTTTTPNPEWLRVPEVPSRELPGIREQTVEVAVATGQHPERATAINGFLFRADLEGRPYFARGAVDQSALSNRLVLRVGTGDSDPVAEPLGVRIRPNGRPHTVSLSLNNPTASPQAVVVRLVAPARETPALTVPAGEAVPIMFLPGMGPGNDAFADAPEALEIQILDAKTRAVRQEYKLPVSVQLPSDLLAVREAVYRHGPPNSLAVTLTERESVRGDPVPVLLVIPAVSKGTVTVRGGRMSSTFRPGQGTVAVQASELTATAGRLGTLDFSLRVDEVPRAYRFRGTLGVGDAVQFQPLTQPALRLEVPSVSTGLSPLPVRVEADGGSSEAKVEVSIGRRSGDEFKSELTLPAFPAQARAVRVKAGPEGKLILTATVGDPSVSLAVERFVGEKWVRAQLRDEDGRVRATAYQKVNFDSIPPRNVRFVSAPATARWDKPVPLQASCDLPASGVKEVRFFLGEPVNDALPPNAVPVVGVKDEESQRWTAAVALGKEPGPVTVSVQFVSNSGLVAFASTRINRLDPAEAEKPKPSGLVGVVVEGEIAQAGLTVQLFDAKGKEVAKAKTDEMGRYTFEGVPAGTYTVFAAKSSTGRERQLPATLEAGETARIRLELLLK